MGVKLGDIIPSQAVEKVELKFFKNKPIAIDGYNILYQFISTIRGPDGRPLMDSRGRITSHLSGLFFRTVNFLEVGMKPVYVFDGQPPQLKRETIQKRIALRKAAEEKYVMAIAAGDVESARKYAAQAASLEKYMVESSIELLDALGIPYIIAPSEGEAQAAYMARMGHVWGSASQDYDSILFGSPRLVRNLSIVGRRKLPGKKTYVEVEIEVIYADKLFSELGIGRDELIEMAILIGTDYFEGIKGIGPKKAYNYIKQYGKVERVLISINETLQFDLEAVRELFRNPEVTNNYKLEWKEIDKERVKRILCDEHDFSEERIDKALASVIETTRETKAETRLDEWFSG
ncbi:MAG: flap endonuclease-1 [Nitrososphaerota archaeon]